jgi:hypothetical protein
VPQFAHSDLQKDNDEGVKRILLMLEEVVRGAYNQGEEPEQWNGD